MRILIRLSLGIGILGALLAGGHYACPKWSARVGLNLTEWLDVERQLAAERRREEILSDQRRQTLENLKAKTRIVEELSDHRLTLLEAASRFRYVSCAAQDNFLEWFRAVYPGQTDEERWCRQVISHVRGHRPKLSSLADQLERELAERLAHGPLRLPHSSLDRCCVRGARARTQTQTN